jgi:hypothetical protein
LIDLAGGGLPVHHDHGLRRWQSGGGTCRKRSVVCQSSSPGLWWMPIRIQATGMAVITIPTFLLGLHVFVSCIQCVESARHDHERQVPKQQRHAAYLYPPSSATIVLVTFSLRSKFCAIQA